MPPFRNPFVKKPPLVNGGPNENLRPNASEGSETGSQRSDYADSRASSSLSIKGRKEEPSEYKLSGTFVTVAVPCNCIEGQVFLTSSSGQ